MLTRHDVTALRHVTRNLGIFKEELEGGGVGIKVQCWLLFEEMGADNEDQKDSIFV
jgi:hypothetical protein